MDQSVEYHHAVGNLLAVTERAVLKATFVRRQSGRDRVYVTRTDGTSTGWDFPSYGAGLPHDLCHLVVEDELGISDGFWALVDRGIDVDMVDNQATLMNQGRPLMQDPGADLTGLVAAEAVVAALTGVGSTLGGGASEPHVVDPEAAARVNERLVALQEKWAALEDGGSITLGFAAR